MKRLEQDYREALDSLRFPKEAKERIMKNLMEQTEQKAAKRRGFRPLRTGLVAAALCAALLGTAFAAANPEAVAGFLRQFAVQVETLPPLEDSGDRIHITAEIVRYPVSSFSPALLAAGEDREPDTSHIRLHFDTREETLAFLGEAIPCVLPEGGKYVVDLFYKFCNDEYQLCDVWVTNNGTPFILTLRIHTEHYFPGDESQLSDMGEFSVLDESKAELLGSFPMANGCEAQVTLFTRDEPDPVTGRACVTYNGVFVREGILYQILDIAPRYPEDELLALVQANLDSFQ